LRQINFIANSCDSVWLPSLDEGCNVFDGFGIMIGNL